jgi:hypothetical protein
MRGYLGESRSSLRNIKDTPTTRKYGYRSPQKVLAQPPAIYLIHEPTIGGYSYGEVCSILQLQGSQSSTDFGDVVRVDRRDGIGGESRTVKDAFPDAQSFLSMGLANRELSRRQEVEGMFRCSTDLMKMLNLVRAVAYTESMVLIDNKQEEKESARSTTLFAADTKIEPS